jgi:hypothetical protein
MALEGATRHRKATTMRRKYFGEEYVFAFIRDNADRDGLWAGDATTLATEFGVSEDEAHEMLAELSDRGLIQKLAPAKFIVVRWRERDERAGAEEHG